MGGLRFGAEAAGFERFPGAASRPLPGTYARHQPEDTVLHQVVREHLGAFLERASEEGKGTLQARAMQATFAFRRSGGGGPTPKARCASIEGFSVHANVAIHANDRVGLEQLIRYLVRNSICLDRLERHPNGGVLYRFKHPMADG